jgi:hypothetical protein
MIGLAEFTLTEDYYREVYDQWYRHVCRWRKWQAPLAVTAALTVIPVWLVGLHIISALVAAFAFTEFVDSLAHRRRWLRERFKSIRLGESVSIRFLAEGIDITGPFSSATWAWKGINSCSVTSRGVFLRPDTGVSMYIPKSAVTPPEAFQHIVTLVTDKGIGVATSPRPT